jgi:hypothetical protein
MVLAGLLAILAGAAHGASQPKRVAFSVTLSATVTKDWNTVTESTVSGCPTSERSIGKRTVTLRSARPTTVLVTLGRGRVSYSPRIVKYVRAGLSQSGSTTTSIQAPCKERMMVSRCTHQRRALGGARFGFFRSKRNEISFRSARLPESSMPCPRESSAVRAIRPGLQQAQGELSESALMDPRGPIQTATATAEIETDLDGQESGRVVEHVRWALTFSRKR